MITHVASTLATDNIVQNLENSYYLFILDSLILSNIVRVTFVN
jgi:hypothetical protein